jgi:His-Xaa-Ser system radical SAM maturase HxsB
MATAYEKVYFKPYHPRPQHTPEAPSQLRTSTGVGSGFRVLPDESIVGISQTGDHLFFTPEEVRLFQNEPAELSLDKQAKLKARFFFDPPPHHNGSQRLLKARTSAKSETIEQGPSLFIIVPTLQCAHSCKYCQVSRSLDDAGYTMSLADLDSACDAVFESPAPAITVEFQGGDPLLRFDLVERAILRISRRNSTENKSIRFVIASTLHQLTSEMCSFFKEYNVFLSTSIDGPEELHNKNRPTKTRDSYARTVRGIELARELMGAHHVSALMTTTKESLAFPDQIVDEYVRLGFTEIFLRPLNSYGFAKRNQERLGYSLEDFADFYMRALRRVFYWNDQGVPLREAYASIVLNKILSTFDSGYVDLQSPCGSGSSVLVFNFDGYIYPSDEARMLAETGDVSLRMGRIGDPLPLILASPVRQALIQASSLTPLLQCDSCAYNKFCAPNPVDAQAQFGSLFAPVLQTEHCRRHMWLFDTMFMLVRTAGEAQLDLYHSWARPAGREELACGA